LTHQRPRYTGWYGIYPQTKKIAENSIPEGAVEGEIFLGRSRYMGPCPLFG